MKPKIVYLVNWKPEERDYEVVKAVMVQQVPARRREGECSWFEILLPDGARQELPGTYLFSRKGDAAQRAIHLATETINRTVANTRRKL